MFSNGQINTNHTLNIHCSKQLRKQRQGTFLTLVVAIPATDLTINNVFLFKRVKAMIFIAQIRVFWRRFPDQLHCTLSVKVLVFFATTDLLRKTIQLHMTTT